MSWKKIKAYKKETLELKKVVSYVFSELAPNYTFVYNSSTYPIDFYKFLKTMYSIYNISPNEVLCFLVRQPHYIQDIYKRNFKSLKDSLLSFSKEENRRLISFVTLFYDNFFRTKCFFKAIRETTRYPFDKFNLEFVKLVFNKYPFLKNKEHLKNVIDKLEKIKYAYYLTKEGIKENYD